MFYIKHVQGGYTSSLTNIQEISRTHLTEFQQDFTLIDPPKYYNLG